MERYRKVPDDESSIPGNSSSMNSGPYCGSLLFWLQKLVDHDLISLQTNLIPIQIRLCDLFPSIQYLKRFLCYAHVVLFDFATLNNKSILHNIPTDLKMHLIDVKHVCQFLKYLFRISNSYLVIVVLEFMLLWFFHLLMQCIETLQSETR